MIQWKLDLLDSEVVVEKWKNHNVYFWASWLVDSSASVTDFSNLVFTWSHSTAQNEANIGCVFLMRMVKQTCAFCYDILCLDFALQLVKVTALVRAWLSFTYFVTVWKEVNDLFYRWHLVYEVFSLCFQKRYRGPSVYTRQLGSTF